MLWSDRTFLPQDNNVTKSDEHSANKKVLTGRTVNLEKRWIIGTTCLILFTHHLYFLPAILLLPSAAAASSASDIRGTAGEDSQQALHRFVRHYEKLNYDQQVLHLRVRRSLNSLNSHYDNVVQLKFASHNRKFHLRLRRDTSAFTWDHVVTNGAGQPVNVDTSFLYQGKVHGQHDSYVDGSIRQGLFEGKIHLPTDVFVVESASRYFKNETDFHSIVYSEKDVIFPESPNHVSSETPDMLHKSSCGMSSSIRQWMHKVQTSADTTAQIEPEHCDTNSSQSVKPDYASIFGGKRSKRATPSTGGTGTGADHDRHRLCNMYIQTDKFLWDAVYEREKNEQRTREEILSIISSHIKAVTRIYGNHRFGDIVGVQFAVQRTTINDSSSCGIDDRNPFCQRYLDVSNLLNYNSMMDHSGFCLAFLFTYRDFAGGTLGLAWVASANGPSGGICETYKRYTETIGGKRVQTFKSLNTGVITFVNYGNRVPPTVSHLTLAHEIGHNFGAAHDPSNPLCQPNGADGNHIMYPSATNGDRPNNDKFSPCSLENMTAVLKAVLNQLNGKRNCFVPNDLAYCGNKIVEKGEECDCGYNVDECKESCCYPRQLDDRWLKEPSAKECTLRFSADIGGRVACSPSQGPCCSSQCTFTAIDPGAPRQMCRHASECTETAFCHSKSAVCPPAIPKADILPCDNNSKVCKGGECNASICLLFDMEQCFLTEEDLARSPSSSARQNKEAMCFVACQFKDRPETCISTRNVDFPFKTARHNVTIDGGIRLRPGAPCNNFRGYCDIFHRCRRVDGDGPLRRLTNSLFSAEALGNAASWITTHWWAVMLMGFAVIIVMGGIIKCCAVHTPSSNPKKRPARRLADDWHSISSTLKRTRRSRPDGVRHHRERNVNRDQARHRRGNGPSNRPNRRRDRGSTAPAQPSAPTDATLLTSPSIPLVQIRNGTEQPPPPYSAVVNETAVAPLLLSPSNASAGPPRGHRKQRSKPVKPPTPQQDQEQAKNQAGRNGRKK